MTPLLFPNLRQPPAPSQVGNVDLSQFFTPEWAAQAIVDEFWPDLVPGRDLVLEPSCGRGAFLKAIPPAVEAVGVEIDPAMAAEAVAHTGRRVLCGDFRTVELDVKPTLIVGNPPYKMRTLEAFLDRACELLPDNGRCGFLLSSYMLQTPDTVLRWNERWSLEQRMVPRTLFPRAIRPLVFVLFTKDRQRRLLGGFLLYKEAAEINRIERGAKLLLVHGKPGRSCWRAVVEWALKGLGGKATVGQLYDAIEPNRPTENRFWQEKVRQTLQRHFRAVERGVWELPERAEAA